MHLSKLLDFFADLRLAISIAFLPTLKAVFRSPGMVLKPREVSRVFMAYVWQMYGPGVDGNSKEVKEGLVRPWARGVVLDVGAGHGHLLPYLDRERVTAYIALEPNTLMHTLIRSKAQECGFSEEEGSFLLLPYGAEEDERISEAVGTWVEGVGKKFVSDANLILPSEHENQAQSPTQVVNTLVLILTLCSLPSPHSTLRALVSSLLAPGGQLLFFEHVRNPRPDVAWWQDVVAPVWKWAFDGCVIGLDGLGVITAAGGEEGWAEKRAWGVEGEDEESLFWHRVGRFVKK